MDNQCSHGMPDLDEEDAFMLSIIATEIEEVAKWKGLGTQLHESVLMQRSPPTSQAHAFYMPTSTPDFGRGTC
jgi:hypothetical protein